MINLRRSIRPTIASLAIIIAVLLSGGVSAYAQRSDGLPNEKADRSPLVQQLESEIGTGAIDFWTPRLNDYKNRIDQVLSENDLAALNRLRIRWSVLLNEAMQSRDAKMAHSDDIVSDGTPKLDTKEMERLTEVMEIFQSAKGLGASYRAELDRLGVQVIDDLGGFADDVVARVDRFASANQQAIAADESARATFAKKKDLGDGLTWLRSSEGGAAIQGIYSFAVEPIILLYDGTDLKTLLNGALPAGTPIAGMDIPDASTLAQNFPNPAATSTLVRYTLKEASSATTLRLYNATGEEVGRFDQGSRSIGDHEATIDVSKLATGTYVYHLSVTTPNGERVYSKVMQVVR